MVLFYSFMGRPRSNGHQTFPGLSLDTGGPYARHAKIVTQVESK